MVEESDTPANDVPNREFEERQFNISNCPITIRATTHKDGPPSFEFLTQGIHESHITPTAIITTSTWWMRERETEMLMETLEAAMAWAKKGFVPPKKEKKK